MRISDWSSDVCSSDLDALLNQGALVLRERTEHLEQEFARGRRSVQVLCQRAERHPLVLERSHNGEQVRQRATEPVEFPHHQHIAGSNELKRPRQAGTVILRARGTILKQVTRIDAGGEPPVALQVRALEVGVRRTAQTGKASVGDKGG